MEVVLADGTFVSVSAQHHPDLFWAMRGGGGSTFGVVVSVVVAAYPKAPVAALSYTVTTGQPGSNISADTFWAGMRAFWDTFLPNADAGHYLYFTLTCRTPNDVHNCTFNLLAHWAHDTTVAELREWTSPYFTRLSSLGIAVAPSFVQYPSVVSAFETTFPANTEQAGTATGHTASRLFPRTNWEDPDLLDRTAAAFRQSIEAGGKMVAYNFGVARNPRVNQTNAATPAWRRAVMFAMLAEPVANNASVAEIVSTSRTLVQLMDSWRALSPGAGSYLNEGDINEPNFQQAFYGSSYDRLYRIKKQYDPHGTFYAYTGVGSEDWYTTDQVPLYPTTNGRLCRKP
ncbi:hypothetical protein VTK73DRAFT_9232 [Phialemonium thermophilum]|uniref:Berberine/berberine-like domain-containing protein n=1 Tax=Phialemonium thermophilum TaxID=223376 RepID=A0ABR3W3N1_9PEZI